MFAGILAKSLYGCCELDWRRLGIAIIDPGSFALLTETSEEESLGSVEESFRVRSAIIYLDEAASTYGQYRRVITCTQSYGGCQNNAV